MTARNTARPITVLIAALGGEGGGVLTDWIVKAARRMDLPVQATSIPGVAQRTGATTYYIEIWPTPYAELNGAEPVLSLYPAPGEVDIVAATEMVEAGRCLQNGFVTPDRTHLIASTHRVFTTREKMATGDGRVDADALAKAASTKAKSAVLTDLGAAARDAGTIINSVMLGAIAASGCLPMSADIFEAAIAAEGKAVEPNLRGFQAGLSVGETDKTKEQPAQLSPQEIIEMAAQRLQSYQDSAYSDQYRARLAPFQDGDQALLADVARHLATRMAYSDISHVARMKMAKDRFKAIRADAKAAATDPVHVVEFFKPGLAEVCDVLPVGLAQSLLRRASSNPDLAEKQWPMQVRTDTVRGFLKLWVLAQLRRWRRNSYRFRMEQAAIDGWLDDVQRAATRSPELGRVVASFTRLIKGYGDTHRRGHATAKHLRDTLFVPALNDEIPLDDAIDSLADAISLALNGTGD